jgi:hypothetical protein
VGAARWLCSGQAPERSAWLGRYARVLLASARCCADLPPSARAVGRLRKGRPNLVKASAPVAGSDDAEGRRAAGRQCGDFAALRSLSSQLSAVCVGGPAYQAPTPTILYSKFYARRSRWDGSWLKGQGAAQIEGKRRVESFCQKNMACSYLDVISHRDCVRRTRLTRASIRFDSLARSIRSNLPQCFTAGAMRRIDSPGRSWDSVLQPTPFG